MTTDGRIFLMKNWCDIEERVTDHAVLCVGYSRKLSNGADGYDQVIGCLNCDQEAAAIAKAEGC